MNNFQMILETIETMSRDEAEQVVTAAFARIHWLQGYEYAQSLKDGKCLPYDTTPSSGAFIQGMHDFNSDQE